MKNGKPIKAGVTVSRDLIDAAGLTWRQKAVCAAVRHLGGGGYVHIDMDYMTWLLGCGRRASYMFIADMVAKKILDATHVEDRRRQMVKVNEKIVQEMCTKKVQKTCTKLVKETCTKKKCKKPALISAENLHYLEGVTPYPNNINIISKYNNHNNNARTRAVVVDFKGVISKDEIKIEQAMMSLGIDRSTYDSLSAEVIADWEFSELPDSEWNFRHFLNTMRIKHREHGKNKRTYSEELQERQRKNATDIISILAGKNGD